MIDLHCHVLPGIDDGPPTPAGALELARAAAAAGSDVLVATPHVNWRYRNDAETIAGAAAELSRRLRAERVTTRAGVALELRSGAEVALTAIAELDPGELERLTLGGGRWLLVEPPFVPVAPNLDGLMLGLLDRDHRVVIAHPERCPAFRREPAMLARLVGAGMLTSVTAASLGGRFGDEARRFALALADEGLLHNVASDAHDVASRPPEIAAEIERAGLGRLGDWLTHEVPAAVLVGERIPRPPGAATAVPRARRGARRVRWPLARNRA